MTGPTWRCSACDTYNDAGLRACEICGTAKSVATAAAKPAPKPAPKPAAKAAPKSAPKAPARPAAKGAAPGSTGAGAKRTPPARTKPKRKPAPKSGAVGGSSATRPSAAKSTGRSGSSASRGSTSDGEATDFARRLADGTLTGPGGEFRASPEVARLLPDLFNPDGSLKDKSIRAGSMDRAWGRIGPTVADGGVIDLIADPKPSPAAKPRARSKPAPKTAAELTKTDEVLGCGCLLVIVAAVITGIVMLVLHWNAIIHWKGIFAHSGHSHSAAPFPTTTASGPCPAPLAAMLPKTEPAGARLVAVYSRKDITEEYAFCRTTTDHYYFFGREGDKSKPFGSSGLATKINGGYDVRSTDATTSVTTDFRFEEGKVEAYVKGKKKWDGPIVPESSIT